MSILLAGSSTFKSAGKRETSTGRESILSLRYRVTGEPSIDAAFINSVLKRYHSPASGDGETFYEQGVRYGIDPVFALAFFMEESTFGTKGVARMTHSLGNIRATPGYHSYHGYRSYKSWMEGSEDWYRLIAQLYVKRWGLTTVDQIIPIYAPSRDRNNPTGYIHNVKRAVDRWRSGIITI
jgi:Mannosyl-glycoprotein endo-beta-N-acetylglucosaminidase